MQARLVEFDDHEVMAGLVPNLSGNCGMGEVSIQADHHSTQIPSSEQLDHAAAFVLVIWDSGLPTHLGRGVLDEAHQQGRTPMRTRAAHVFAVQAIAT